MDIQIARITKDDIDKLEQLFNEVITDNFKFEGCDLEEYSESINKLINYQIACINRDIESEGLNDYYLVAKADGKIIGTIAYGLVSETINSITQFDSNDISEIKSAYILPEYQNKGVGTILLNCILISMMQAGIKEFCLYTGFEKGLSFWKRKFGNPDIIAKDYFDIDENCYIWHKKIEDVEIKFGLV